jgi:hypothetical protein
MIESEVLMLTKHGYVTKEAIKSLESRIERRLNNQISLSVDFFPTKRRTDGRQVTKSMHISPQAQ